LWAELELVVDLDRSPVELMSRIARAIPPTSGVRLTTAEINAGQIKLVGEAQQAAPVSQFSVNLTRESYGLAEYQWDNAPPSNSSKGWAFQFTGVLPEAEVP
jgi:Tfp pilus assembly protein PilN